ncbi:MAG: NAD(P)H-dependent oxidoreductase [Proteobacteria bacterium]|nr:MAG: NAD(P)H-dependent oxidoreductase [Pseudomonadota bacterium]
MKKKVGVIVGSLRKDSINRKVAQSMIDLNNADLEMKMIEIGALQMYNPDTDDAAPTAEWSAFRENVKSMDAILFVTPEYNRSVPGVMKNAIDVGSRPYGKSAWAGKPAAVASASPGAMGAFGANHHLRQSLVFLDMPAMQQPEAYLGHADNFFGPDGKLANDSTKEFFSKFLQAFSAFVGRNAPTKNS